MAPKKPALPPLSPQAKRNLRFAGVAVGGSLLAFVLMGFVVTAVAPQTNVFLIALVAGPLMGVAAARFLYGWPKLETRHGTPLVSDRARPWLWFPLFALATSVGYVLLGVVLTPLLPVDWVAYVSLAASAVAGGVAAYFLVGFPHMVAFAKEQWGRVPPERRPWLFFPIGALLALASFFLVGLGITQTPIPLEIQPLIVLPLALAIGATLAFLLVGFPRPPKPLASYVPEVPGRARPATFLVTWLALGLPLTYLSGLALALVPRFPDVALLPVAFVLGFAAAMGVSAAVWGTPRRWRRFADYKPGLPEGARRALFVPIVVGVALVGALVAGLVGIDLFPGILLGAAAGVLVALWATGALRDPRRARLPEFPDMVKPLVLFPTWLLVGGLVFTVLVYALPDYAAWHALAGLVVGLLVAVALVEAPTLRAWRAERDAERRRMAALKERRKRALAEPTAPPAAPPKP